jgi:glyoxylase-like metal-dependent hydrolase (beta-lactamase superfamily II)
MRELWPDMPILLHEAEHDFLLEPQLNLSAFLAEPIVAPAATGSLAHGDTLSLQGVHFEIRHTPGHSPGGVTLYQPDNAVAIVGDTLFASSIGRSDFPTSNGNVLMQSIREQLLTLPDATRILPGHGPASTIGAERAGNPFLHSS